MKLFVLVLCLAVAVCAGEDFSSQDKPDVFDYHRRFGIPRAAQLQKLETEDPTVGNRIVGGYLVDITQVPYQAGLVITLISGRASVCGGSLISHNRVVTAAHCQYDGVNTATSMTVVLGTNTIFSGGIRLITFDVIIHPAWEPSNANSDVAVIRLPVSVAYTNQIQPILLPDSEVTNDFLNWNAIASGYGITADGASIVSTQRLSAVWLPVISNEQCSAVYGHWVHDTNICTSGIGGRGTCTGDSGGPLAVNIGNFRFLIGVHSYGSDLGCQVGLPASFARVTSFINWIRSV